MKDVTIEKLFLIEKDGNFNIIKSKHEINFSIWSFSLANEGPDNLIMEKD